MTWTPERKPPHRGRSIPPDRLSAVLDEVDHARRAGGWLPEEPADRGRRAAGNGPSRSDRGAVQSATEGGGAEGDRDRPRHLRTGPDRTIRPHTPLVRPPRSLQDAVVAPGRLAAAAVLVLVLAAGAVLGGRVLWLRTTSEPTPVAPAGVVPSATARDTVQGRPRAVPHEGAAPATGTPPAASSPTSILVHVVGQVEKPGVVSLKTGARVRDALEAAGGARSGADLTQLNLARPVADGEQVAVPKPGEEITPPPGPPSGVVPDSGNSSTRPGAPQAGPVDLNQADESALEELPGVGPVLAGRIVQWRTENGPFTAVDELGEVSGIGEKMLAQLRPHVTV